MRLTSRTPASASRSISARIFPTGRAISAPRVYGTTQKVQNLSQPSCTVMKADAPRLRIAMRSGAARWLNLSSTGNSVSTALRPDNEVDGRRAADDLFAFGLGHTAGDRNGDAPAGRRRLVFHAAHPAELGVDFLDGLFTDVAGVEDDQISVGGSRGLDIALRCQGVRHTLRVVDVHLAAERFDIDFIRAVHARWSARRRLVWTIELIQGPVHRVPSS